jgi:hypothetical protein
MSGDAQGSSRRLARLSRRRRDRERLRRGRQQCDIEVQIGHDARGRAAQAGEGARVGAAEPLRARGQPTLAAVVPVSNTGELATALARVKSGATIPVEIVRKGKKLTVEVEVGQRRADGLWERVRHDLRYGRP